MKRSKRPKRRPRVTTRIEWAADDGPWVVEQRRRLKAGLIRDYPKGTAWATFCRLAVIRATIPDSASGGTVVSADIALQLSPAAIAKLTQPGLTNAGTIIPILQRPKKPSA